MTTQTTIGGMLLERANRFLHLAAGAPDDEMEARLNAHSDELVHDAARFGEPEAEATVAYWAANQAPYQRELWELAAGF